MKVLIVHAHPGKDSFNAAMKDQAVQTLTADGHDVQVSDLYAMGFDSVPSAADFTAPLDTSDSLTIDLEQEYQFAQGEFSADIVAEQEKVMWCDLMIFQFPIWWFSMPAILKAWVERVMARGFAYGGGRKHAKGVFRGRKAMVSCTTGTAASTYAEDGIEGHIQNLLWPVTNGVFHYMGFEPLPSFVAFAPRNLSGEQRQEILQAYAERLSTLDSTQPLFMHPREDYGANQRLLPDVEPKSGFQWHDFENTEVPPISDEQTYLR